VLIAGALLLVGGGGVGGYLATRGGTPAQGASEPQQQVAEQGGAAVPAQGGAAPGPSGAQPAPAVSEPTTGRVSVTNLPSSGTVTIDGRQRSGRDFELAPGSHEIRMAAAGFAPVTTTITVEVGERTTLPFTGQRVTQAAPAPRQTTTPVSEPPPAATQPDPAANTAQLATLQISIAPPANLTINNVSKGRTSRIRETLVPGTHVVHVELEGYLPFDTTVTLKAGDLKTLPLRLVARQ
jgi:hypothetical protein